MKKQKKVEHDRSAITGKYVTRKYALQHPKTTEREHDVVPARRKPKVKAK